MEQKTHRAWGSFGTGEVPRESLHVHFEQEYRTYVRDFPVMVGWAYVQCPIAEVRRELAENLYEEETGGLVAKRPHPELFLEYPRGLGMDLSRFERVELLPKAAAYRALLDELTMRSGWEVAAAVTTLFIEGTEFERGEIDGNAPRRPVMPSRASSPRRSLRSAARVARVDEGAPQRGGQSSPGRVAHRARPRTGRCPRAGRRSADAGSSGVEVLSRRRCHGLWFVGLGLLKGRASIGSTSLAIQKRPCCRGF